jgi:predicted metal-dependent enzyme (double-stranded beta helix superfamily)
MTGSTQTLVQRTAALVADVRKLIETQADDTLRLPHAIGATLGRHLQSPGLLDGVDLEPDPRGYRQVVLHAEPDGSFSIVALVWLPGQATAVHDHLAWCVVGVVRGAESEVCYRLEATEGRCCLVTAGQQVNAEGTVQVLLPPGDIHRVTNDGPDVAVSLHIYGIDVNRVGSSIRRVYDGMEIVESR